MTRRKLLCVAGILLLTLSYNSVAEAQRGRQRLEYLGRSYVDDRRDHDVIRVYKPGAFRGIQLQVQGGTIEFNRVIVHFENGADTDIAIRDRISAGGKTRVIDLPGDRRKMRSVEVWYENGIWGKRRPQLRLYGLQ